MTAPINDGGPAFPQQLSDGQRERGDTAMFGLGGMSLRDYFAAATLQGSLASPECIVQVEELAKWSYEVADAMLRARENKS